MYYKREIFFFRDQLLYTDYGDAPADDFCQNCIQEKRGELQGNDQGGKQHSLQRSRAPDLLVNAGEIHVSPCSTLIQTPHQL